MKNICIVGTGAAGWMSCAYLASMSSIIGKITIIGSPNIPTIGVGESNTMSLLDFHNKIGVNHREFVSQTDAAVKYGVMYQNWSKNDFLHGFKNGKLFNDRYGVSLSQFFRFLINKPKEDHIYKYFGGQLDSIISQNNVINNDEITFPFSWHFDAGLYIEFLSKFCKQFKNVEFISGTVKHVEKQGKSIKHIVLDDGKVISEDYYVFATGYHDLLNDEYVDINDVLLTNKALVYPLKFTDKRKEFHPYTVAKTMKHGWRWITPTYSRIGTGYVFSSNHVSVDEAKDEFVKDIGQDIEPMVVDFYPRYNKESFKDNYCTVGLSNGFLEPLDAPGLTLSIESLRHLISLFINETKNNDKNIIKQLIVNANEVMENRYKFWAAFILCQYKTCWRKDTQFWLDHKNVKYDYYDYSLNNLDNLYNSYNDYTMFTHTISAKDQTWPVFTPCSVTPFEEPKVTHLKTIHHCDYVDSFRTSVNYNRHPAIT
jgi:tryptophan halogenase